MISILKKLKNEYGVLAVKAEFEAEGTRSDEFLRLLDLTKRAGLEVALKIGGAEAIRDLFESKQFGIDYIIAPMVESSYALSKYIEAIQKSYSEEERKYTKFLFNLETKKTMDELNDMQKILQSTSLNIGVVFGRVDFTLSSGLTRSEVNSDVIFEHCFKAAQWSKNQGLDFVVGGAVSEESIEFLRRIKEIGLTRFETRKVIFGFESLNDDKIYKGIKLAVQFELLWLKNKKNHYYNISNEDNLRIAMLEKRISSSI
jgi:hypothetical protein